MSWVVPAPRRRNGSVSESLDAAFAEQCEFAGWIESVIQQISLPTMRRPLSRRYRHHSDNQAGLLASGSFSTQPSRDESQTLESQWSSWASSPVTAAGPRRILTVFPILQTGNKPVRHLCREGVYGKTKSCQRILCCQLIVGPAIVCFQSYQGLITPPIKEGQPRKFVAGRSNSTPRAQLKGSATRAGRTEIRQPVAQKPTATLTESGIPQHGQDLLPLRRRLDRKGGPQVAWQ